MQRGRILLVRYRNKSRGTFLVAPGGGVLANEGLTQGLIREVREETGLEVAPHRNRILFVEDLAFSLHRLVKVWFLCDLVGGQLADTSGAREEGIIEAGWYRRDQLDGEVVYPPPLLSHDWGMFSADNWETLYLGLRSVPASDESSEQ